MSIWTEKLLHQMTFDINQEHNVYWFDAKSFLLQLTHKLGGGGVCKKRHADKGEGRGTSYQPKMMMSFMNSPNYLENLETTEESYYFVPPIGDQTLSSLTDQALWKTFVPPASRELAAFQLPLFLLTSFSNPYHWNFVTLVYFVCLIQSAILNAQSSNGTFITTILSHSA